MTADYRRALEVAVKASQAAGELLRSQFHRSGGPLEAPGSAPVDLEAEQLIRSRLLEAFPSWGYQGEETGARRGEGGESHCWLVDPHDGTAGFQKGQRGTAVSLALLRDGQPVLGVVNAFSAPDDDGDLFAWAEGCGPILRNGRPVVRGPWPTELGPYDLVLLSSPAEEKPRASALLVAPGRFLTFPSVAYRLALVAVGEAAAAVSLSSPSGWDLAAGHALLRGAGGELVDERGRPVTYSASGAIQILFCFGGPLPIITALARRNWGRMSEARAEPRSPYGPVSPERGRGIAATGLLARAQGCLLGQLAGDALGSASEFEAGEAIAQRHPRGLLLMADGGAWNTIAGQPTDDSELALMLARSLVRAGRYNPEASAQAYRFWFHSEPFDCGNTIAQALKAITEEDVAAGAAAVAARKAANPESQANGSLMRLSPLGIWGHALPPAELAEFARADAQLTHPNPVCRDAAAVYAVAVAHAVATGAAPAAVYESTLAWAKEQAMEPAVLQALSDSAHRTPDYMHQMGWCLVALQNAFYQLLHAPALEEGVVQTVMCGGDTDTNAAVAGALLGAVYGRAAIPLQWQHMVLSSRPIEELANVRQPRPRDFWPGDALELAELLAAL